MYENAKLCKLNRMVRIFVKKMNDSPQCLDFRKEINNNMLSSRNAKKVVYMFLLLFALVTGQVPLQCTLLIATFWGYP